MAKAAILKTAHLAPHARHLPLTLRLRAGTWGGNPGVFHYRAQFRAGVSRQNQTAASGSLNHPGHRRSHIVRRTEYRASLGFTLPIKTVVGGSARRAPAISSSQSTSKMHAPVLPMSETIQFALPENGWTSECRRPALPRPNVLRDQGRSADKGGRNQA